MRFYRHFYRAFFHATQQRSSQPLTYFPTSLLPSFLPSWGDGGLLTDHSYQLFFFFSSSKCSRFFTTRDKTRARSREIKN